ncbi:MAG: hypothetical protein H7Z14_19955, partial [Anaerolineae bacterium]|nr:hypothetical protein [Phycisphaerae bacterium]
MTRLNGTKFTRLSLATMFLSSSVALFNTRALAQDPPAPETPPATAPTDTPAAPAPETPAPETPAPAPE